jgi:membrane protein
MGERVGGATTGKARRGTRGRDAGSPTEVDAGGWSDVAKRVVAGVKRDHLALMSAGVAFYFLLALIPAIAALVSLYGLVADPARVAEQLGSFLEAAPEDVRRLVVEQAERIAEGSGTAVGLGALLSILLALWAASSGCQHLVEAVNLAYDEEETRGFIARRGRALAMTVAAVVFLAVSVGAIVVLPAALSGTALGDAARTALEFGRWPLLAIATMVALAMLYRHAPDRDEPRWQWVSVGAVLATLLWLVGSAGFSVYVANFGNYNETYGSLGAIVVVMLWLFITAFCMILGAEINAESERQTRRDTTAGEPAPMGARDAHAADTLGEGDDGVSGKGDWRGEGSHAPERAAGSGRARSRPD